MDKKKLQQTIADCEAAAIEEDNALFDWLLEGKKKDAVRNYSRWIEAQQQLIELLQSDIKRYENAQVEKLKADCEGQVVFSSYLEQMFGENLKPY